MYKIHDTTNPENETVIKTIGKLAKLIAAMDEPTFIYFTLCMCTPKDQMNPHQIKFMNKVAELTLE